MRCTLAALMLMFLSASAASTADAAPNQIGRAKISADQIRDYARRKAMPRPQVERWLAPNLGYEPDR